MKSTEAYRVLRSSLAPRFKDAGFNRANGFLSWMRPSDGHYVVVWCQVSQSGWDDFSGSQFTVEFQVSEEPTIGCHPSRRQRFPAMLDDKGREEIRGIQNDVISALRRPPANHPLLHAGDMVRAHHLKKFQTIVRPYGERDDIWFRYAREVDLVRWAHLVVKYLPDCLREVGAWAPSSG